jgi:hypothetical protein
LIADLSSYAVASDRRMGHPSGFVKDLSEFVTPLTPAQGASTSVYASFEPSLTSKLTPQHSYAMKRLTRCKAHNGKYLLKNKVSDPYVDEVKPWATSSVEARKLWTMSEKMVGQEFRY